MLRVLIPVIITIILLGVYKSTKIIEMTEITLFNYKSNTLL